MSVCVSTVDEALTVTVCSVMPDELDLIYSMNLVYSMVNHTRPTCCMQRNVT